MTRIFASPLFRLALFGAALLLLPLLAILLAGQDWPAATMIVGHLTRPLLLSCLLLAVVAVVLDTLTRLRTGSSLLLKQRAYLLWCAGAGATSAVLLAWLNLFVTSWISPALSNAQMLLLSALAGAIMLPAVLITRLWLAGFNGLSRSCSRLPALPVAGAEQSAALLLLLALIGLLSGSVWPEKMFWLLWPAPLLLLAALQLLWHESTVFSGLKQGDWSRVVLGSAAGILVAAFVLASYRLYGGALYIRHATAFVGFAFAAYGLLCLQLGDIVAEHWRGKSLLQTFQSKKPFPISVVSKKD
jgi:hypothetical protein